jgi:hypothetical protein
MALTIEMIAPLMPKQPKKEKIIVAPALHSALYSFRYYILLGSRKFFAAAWQSKKRKFLVFRINNRRFLLNLNF